MGNKGLVLGPQAPRFDKKYFVTLYIMSLCHIFCLIAI